ncbi:hypothetical protein RRG08_022249 [Elysia crispata]|uniref:Uncharacterized protein n=1 Tax=Elysia crispata TaxID=231223 RepID=A0AAE1DK86_9GAST|nr:hypothetical protein RRG08_022249 [Elysia crispata]
MNSANYREEDTKTGHIIELSNSATQVASLTEKNYSDKSVDDDNFRADKVVCNSNVAYASSKDGAQSDTSNTKDTDSTAEKDGAQSDSCNTKDTDSTAEKDGAQSDRCNTKDADSTAEKDGAQSSVEEEKHEDKYLKTLELAMVELRPIPKPLDESLFDHQEGQDNSEGIDQILNMGARETSEVEAFKEDTKNLSQAEPHKVTVEANSNQNNSSEIATTDATISTDHSTAVSCQPTTLGSEALSPTNTDSRSQPAETIASAAGSEKEPIDCPCPTEAIKPHKTQGINNASVTAPPVPLSVSHNAPQTKAEELKTESPTDKGVDHNYKYKNSIPKTVKDSSCGPNIPRSLSNSDVGETNIKSYGQPALHHTFRSRSSTRDKCRPGQRALTKTGHSNGGNHYQNSAMPVIAGAGHKCFPLNNVLSKDGRQLNSPIPNYERPYGKRELRRALPRKSNFNCHDAAMKEAGFEDESIAKRKAERLKQRLARVANSFNPLLGMSSYVATGHVPSRVEVVVTDEDNKTNSNLEADAKDIEAVAARNLPAIQLPAAADVASQELHSRDSLTLEIKENSESLGHLLGGSGLGGAAGGGETTGAPRRRRPGSARIEYVDCKPLSQYLEYIRDNRQEYINYVRQQQQQHQASRRDKPVATLIKMGQAFELRHQGGTTRNRKTTGLVVDYLDGPCTNGTDSGTDVIVMAAKALRPRSATPGKYSKTRDKSGGGGRRVAEAVARPHSEDRKSSQAEKGVHGPAAAGTGGGALHGNKEEEHPKTELEKRKLRAEDWTRSVPTHTLTRARIQSLRELGADDAELTKWWEALKGCHYLRKNICET